jgi:hypothetical protein
VPEQPKPQVRRSKGQAAPGIHELQGDGRHLHFEPGGARRREGPSVLPEGRRPLEDPSRRCVVPGARNHGRGHCRWHRPHDSGGRDDRRRVEPLDGRQGGNAGRAAQQGCAGRREHGGLFVLPPDLARRHFQRGCRGCSGSSHQAVHRLRLQSGRKGRRHVRGHGHLRPGGGARLRSILRARRNSESPLRRRLGLIRARIGS